MENGQISLVVVDDHPQARKNINNLIKDADDMVIVGEASNGTQAIDLAHSKMPDIMLLDVELPDTMGTAVMRYLNANLPDLKVLAVSSYNDRQFILGMMENGASGYLVKDEVPVMLLYAIRSIVHKGREWIGPRFEEKSLASKLEQTLTMKEVKIMKQLSVDRSENMIATDLGMNVGQVDKYLALLMKKYQVTSLSELKKIAGELFPNFKH